MSRSAQKALLVALTLAATATAQQLATYDPAAAPNQEYAAVACGPAPAIATVDDLVSPPPAAQWWLGATAADNKKQRLYYTTGWPAAGIQRVPFAAIGTGALPTVFSAPAGFNQITGLAVDPSDVTGDTVFVTDGFVIAQYHAPSATIVAGPFPAPLVGANPITGLGINPFSGRLWTIDENSTMHSRLVTGGPWMLQTPAVAVPVRATGISFCKVSGGPPFASYWNGTVGNVVTGANVPFPGAPAGTRHHRGLTFVGRAIKLGGGAGGSSTPPWIEVPNGFEVGNATAAVVVDNPTPIGVLGVDLAPMFGPGISVPGIAGTLMLNPATTVTVPLGPGSNTVPLGLVGVPPGIGLTFQAVGLDVGGLVLGNALNLTTHL